jgi:putative heme-binding domain-containing protein
VGGKVGPNLTGIGSREPKEILVDILDPNRSVEANYRSWIVSTGDETYAGRLESETQTSVEILDSTGQKHVIQRKDIKQMNTSGTSIMPNGFESLPETDLSALLAYLATPATETGVASHAGESAKK